MAITIKTPPKSFVQFAESDAIVSCNYDEFSLCLPVYLDSDVAFQFVLQTETSGQADALCASNSNVQIGIAENCSDSPLLIFSETPEKFRLSDTQVLYNWSHGLTNFASVISRGECFHIKVIVTTDAEYDFCSNCFQRIDDPCHTSVIDYGNDENAFGFNYCATAPVDDSGAADCEPTFITFTNQSVLSIPYTAFLQAKYGTMPTVNVWIYDESGELVDMGIRVTFDAYPPSLINFNFGGSASGIIKIA